MAKSQTSTEYLILIGAIIAIIAILSIFIIRSNPESEKAKIELFADNLVNAINQISELGPGNQIRVSLEIPENIDKISFQNRTVNMIFFNETENKIEINRYIKANVSGFLAEDKVHPGLYNIAFISFTGGQVCTSKIQDIEIKCPEP